MEKKQLISVVKPLIAAALLFGSSGGVAWGQIYKSQRNPERAQLRAGIGGSIDSNSTGHYWWNGSWDVTSSFTVENNMDQVKQEHLSQKQVSVPTPELGSMGVLM